MKDQIIKSLSITNLSKDEIEKLIETPKDPTLGDFAFPCFVLAKTMKKNPVEIAKDLAVKINSKDFEKVQATGPYINFFLKKGNLAKEVLSKILKEKAKYGSQKINEKLVIEFPSPNTNKPLHIGHARNIVLGQAVSEISRFSGNKVIIVNLANDRGVHICKSMLAYDKWGKGDSPEKAKRKSDHFVGDYYVKFAQAAKENPKLEEEAQEYLRKWEAGDKKIIELWKKMNKWALEGFEETYKKFNLKANKDYLESEIYKKGKSIVLDALKKGIVQKKPDGAIFIDLTLEGLGEKFLLRADGTSIYIIQDIYLAVLKQKDFKFNKSIYICAVEQDYHFKVLFATLKKLGYAWAEKLYHLSYGMVNLESGRMKSREGNVVDSDNLIDELTNMASEEIKKREDKLSQKEVQTRARAIAMAALRYYYLKVDPKRDVIFQPEESIKFEGNTGPYLLYTYARANSILEKEKQSSAKYKIPSILTDQEKQLVTRLNEFPEIVQKSYHDLAPNHIANYAHQLAQNFNEFYHNSKVIGSEEESFRINLVKATMQVLENSLLLLGIKPIKKM